MTASCCGSTHITLSPQQGVPLAFLTLPSDGQASRDVSLSSRRGIGLRGLTPCHQRPSAT